MNRILFIMLAIMLFRSPNCTFAMNLDGIIKYSVIQKAKRDVCQLINKSKCHCFSLQAWSEKIFTERPEYSAEISLNEQYPKPIFSAQEFVNLADGFVECFEESDFNLESCWLNYQKPPKTFFTKPSLSGMVKNFDDYIIVQRKTVSPGSQCAIIGDIHGSIHSLLRNLWRLVQLGKLADDLSIKDPNFYMIFNGDFVNRGRYGIEVWYTLLQLKKANWDNVFLLRGNHEQVVIQNRDGFAGRKYDPMQGELAEKFDIYAPAVRYAIARLCTFLPHALYFGSGTSSQNYYFQCCHGGIEVRFNPIPLLTEKEDLWQLIPMDRAALLKPDMQLFQHTTLVNPLLDTEHWVHSGFNWSDFCQQGDGMIHHNEIRSAGYMADVYATRNYIDFINNHLKDTQLVGFIRGHQDLGFGCKMLFNPEKFDYQALYKGYENGPFHWREVVKVPSAVVPAKHVPVFTFSTAAEGQGVPYDCFGIMMFGKNFKTCLLNIHEAFLCDNNERHNCYVSIKQSEIQNTKNIIDITWTAEPMQQPIDRGLFANL